jgi:hypothetical protein
MGARHKGGTRARAAGMTKAETAEFSDMVVALQKWALDSRSSPPPSDNLDVRRVAFGLAAIQKLIRERGKVLKGAGDLDGFTAEGLKAADDIVEALLTGREHPIFDYVDGIRTNRGSGRPRPLNKEWVSRGCIVGAVEAYRKAAAVSEAEAIRVIIESCSSSDFKLTYEQIRSWQRQFNDRKGEDVHVAAENSILQRAQSDPRDIPLTRRIIEAGQLYVLNFRSIPAVK